MHYIVYAIRNIKKIDTYDVNGAFLLINKNTLAIEWLHVYPDFSIYNYMIQLVNDNYK